MKNLLVTILFSLVGYLGYSQSFFVEKNIDGFEQPILNKLIELKEEVSINQQSSEYTIQCTVTTSGMGRAKGFISIFDNKTGKLLVKSKTVTGQTSAFNGYASPKMNVMKKIAKNYLETLVKEVKSRR